MLVSLNYYRHKNDKNIKHQNYILSDLLYCWNSLVIEKCIFLNEYISMQWIKYEILFVPTSCKHLLYFRERWLPQLNLITIHNKSVYTRLSSLIQDWSLFSYHMTLWKHSSSWVLPPRICPKCMVWECSYLVTSYSS